MEAGRVIAISVAGFDPSGGAGLTADIKTFEQHRVYGLGIITALTVQTAEKCISVRWETNAHILEGLRLMLDAYNVRAVKIGAVKDAVMLHEIVSLVRATDSGIHIVADTVMSATSGFDFWTKSIDHKLLRETLSLIDVITPNYREIMQLVPGEDAKEAAATLGAYCAVLLKGGHNPGEPGVDYLYRSGNVSRITGQPGRLPPKHGSGCVLSAAIAANLALGYDIPGACRNAKLYIEKFLSSNQSLLGYHYA